MINFVRALFGNMKRETVTNKLFRMALKELFEHWKVKGGHIKVHS